jgi:NAD+ diphosphatase
VALADLALSRSRLDKISDDRFEPGLVRRLLADPSTHLLALHDGAAPALEGPSGPTLRTLTGDPAAALVDALGGVDVLADSGVDPATETVVVHLGRYPADDERAPAALVGLLLPGVDPDTAPAAAFDGARRAGLREVGSSLPDLDAGAMTEAVALQHWHLSHRRCPRCGAATRVGAAGHERVCVEDGTTHHPRHDPAVIMTVTDPAGRLLLGHQGRWAQGRFSAFAGFVEPGESLEQAVARELLEEAGVHAHTVTYLGSQPWPFPASLMLAFHAETDDTTATPDGGEITEARWFTPEGLREAVATGEVTVPPTVSVARRLIERWLGGPVEQSDTWR